MEHLIVNGGEEYLGFARGRIKAMRSITLVPYASQQFNLGTALIRLSIEPGHEYIRIDDSPAVYQFFSSGPTLQTEVLAGSKDFAVSKGYSFSVSKNPKASAKNKLKAKVHGSSIEAGPADAQGKPKWPFLGLHGPFEKSFPIKNIFQIQAISEYAYYPAGSSGKISGKNKLMNSWSCSRQIEGLLSNSGTYQILSESSMGPVTAIYYTGIFTMHCDVAYDLPPAIGMGKYVVPDADWYKRAAVKTVTHKKYGTRKFIILTDISGIFHVYPAAVDIDMRLDEASAEAAFRFEGQSIKTNVASDFVRKLATPYPDWCRKNTGASSRQATNDEDAFFKTLHRVPQYRWAFNSDASKACAVVYEDLKTGITESGSSLKADNSHYTFSAFYVGSAPVYESLPGLLELDIHIGLLGPGLNDFEFALTVAQEMQPTLTGKYIVGADYAWPIKDHTDKDDLILMTGSVYHTSPTREQMPKIFNLRVNKTVVDIENFTANKIVRSFLVKASNEIYSIDRLDGSYYNGADLLFLNQPQDTQLKKGDAVFLSVDLRVLAFVIRQKYSVRQVNWNANANSIPHSALGTLAYNAESAVRVQTYMRNKLEDEITLENSTLDAELDSFFYNDFVQGMYKMPITERGGLYLLNTDAPPVNGRYPVNGYESIHRIGGYAGSAYMQYETDNKTNHRSDGSTYSLTYDVGALTYAFFVVSALQQDHSAIFAVHPNGSWSVATQQITYFSGAPADGAGGSMNLAVERMRSTFVDIVSIRLPATTAQENLGELGKEVRTTHLDLLNEALETNYTKADFLPKFEIRTWDSGMYTMFYLVDSVAEKANLVGYSRIAGQYSSQSPPDVLPPDLWNFETGPRNYWGAIVDFENFRRSDNSIVLGGSAMFI